MPNNQTRKFTAISCKHPTLAQFKSISREMALMTHDDLASNDDVLQKLFDHWKQTKHLAFRDITA
jgi:hypothetical protein